MKKKQPINDIVDFHFKSPAHPLFYLLAQSETSPHT